MTPEKIDQALAACTETKWFSYRYMHSVEDRQIAKSKGCGCFLDHYAWLHLEGAQDWTDPRIGDEPELIDLADRIRLADPENTHDNQRVDSRIYNFQDQFKHPLDMANAIRALYI